MFPVYSVTDVPGCSPRGRCLAELAEVLAAVQHREEFDRVGMDPVHQAVRPLDQLADLRAREFRDDATRFGELARLIQAAGDAVNQLLGVDGRGKADMIGYRLELGDGVLRPAERAHLGGAADPRADTGERLIVAQDAVGIGVGEPGLDRLADVHFVREVVPSRGIGEALDEAAGLGFDIRRVTHGCKLARRPERSQGGERRTAVAG